MFTGRMLFLPPNHSAKAPKAITQGNSVRSKSDGNQVNLTKTEKKQECCRHWQIDASFHWHYSHSSHGIRTQSRHASL